MAPSTADSAALARGGRTNVAGFVLRLGARLPFLFIAARLYGPADLGRFAYATMAVELAAALALLGLKRGLALEMARDAPHRPAAHSIVDAMVAALGLGLAAVLLLCALPVLAFPGGARGPEPLIALVVPLIILADLLLAALAVRHRIADQVRARSVIEPWVLTLAATALAFTPVKSGGLLIAYALSILAAAAASVVPALRVFGWPRGWRPSAARTVALVQRLLPLAGAELLEWATRRLDIILLGRFASAELVGIYYVAQQVASLAGKIRTSFDPILAPMLSAALAAGDRARAAGHVRQVGFWVLAFQLPVALALALAAGGILGLFGPAFAAGALVLALLLAAEVAGANASVPEMALVYAAPRANLAIAGAGLALQAGLSLLMIPRLGAEGAAAALLAGLAAAGLARQWLLGRRLAQPIGFWRWSLVACAVPAIALGLLVAPLPEWARPAITVPGVLGLYLVLLWRFGFTAADRMLGTAPRRPPAAEG